jgi:hypothetical protein
LLAVAAVAACESPTSPGIQAEPLLQTASGEYTFVAAPDGGRELAVPYTFTNRTEHPVSLGNCQGVFSHGLERQTPEGWLRSWSATVILCHSDPIRIAPGDSWAGEVVVRAVPSAALSGAELPLAQDLDGTYRLVWDLPVSQGPAGEQVLDKELRVSNPFRVRLP